ncbi:MAG: preprotein translocase subunit SecE [Anaerolineaceae bacterium]|jgi:preprotein translocase subunit SecE|nr:preprotein translocase subunit SecE [Anaerolineaceae bacterium]MDD4042678.1 preprotein translocase subunit SecE [Anaerolineaceae bacterium]MDD4577790.1 preprotein translocase subunit SecE [Anaerolineaceae bacterium]
MAQKDNKPNLFQKIKNWWRQTTGELRKVTWPTREEALALTRIVLIVTVIMSAILGVLDFVFARLVGLLVG